MCQLILITEETRHSRALKFFSSNSIQIIECTGTRVQLVFMRSEERITWKTMIHSDETSVYKNIWTIKQHIFNAAFIMD